MRKSVFRFALLAACIAGTGITPVAAQAQSWPARAITILVPFPAGCTSDNLARSLGQNLSDGRKQRVVNENKPGAGIMIGTQQVTRSNPDGYTFRMVANSFTINPRQHAGMRYDPRKDFAPVS